MQTRVAVMSIILHDCARAGEVNALLHAYNEYIIGRMGLPYRQKGIYIINSEIARAGRHQRPCRQDRPFAGREHQDRLFGLCQRWQR